jgi:hypothetical protein
MQAYVKFVNERELVSGNSAFDKKTYENFRKAERDAQSEIKDLDDHGDLITKMGKSKDIATRRQILRKLASEQDCLSESNLDDIAKELGIEFKEGSSREDKIKQTIEKLNFGNKYYQEVGGKDLSKDISKALAKNGDYTYNHEQLAKGAKASDPVISYLKTKSGEKQISSMTETNFTQRDAQGETVLNTQRLESFLADAVADADLRNEKLFSKLPSRGEWKTWMEKAYPDRTQAPPKVQLFYNQVVGSAGGAKQSKKTGAATSTQSANQNVAPNNSNTAGSNMNASTNPSIDPDEMND